ncbi:MAG: peptidase and matrixin and adamalysin, partial [Myxococcales bacterium]|nr:peptidase and matrixin and adamalysin [Myxococcales bacterium]
MKPRAVALGLALALLASGRADAYVRSKTSDKMLPKFWAESCIPVTIYLNKFKFPQYGQQQSNDAVVKSLTAAAHAWSPDLVTCDGNGVPSQPYLEIVPTFAPAEASPPAVASDHRNSIIFRYEMWTKSGVPAKVPRDQYSDEAVAVTTVFALQDGRIQDADIEINATPELWSWANLDAGVVAPVNQHLNGDVYDLQTALTHEFGHLLGLEHTCFVPVVPGGPVDSNNVPRPVDDQGRGVPDCADASSDIELTVMYYKTSNQDTSKRVLSQDEINFLCTVYPASKDPRICRADQPNTGCATASAPARHGNAGPRGGALGLLAAGGL